MGPWVASTLPSEGRREWALDLEREEAEGSLPQSVKQMEQK